MDMTTLGDYLERFNPFGLKNEKGRILHFKTRDDIYLYTLKEIRKYCKRGYIELTLLMKHLTGFDESTCEDLANAARKYEKTLAKDPIFVDWSNVGYEKDRLEAIIKALHILTETEFVWASFEYAWIMFRQFNEVYTNNGEDNEKTSDDA